MNMVKGLRQFGWLWLWHSILARIEYAYNPFYWTYHQMRAAQIEGKVIAGLLKWE